MMGYKGLVTMYSIVPKIVQGYSYASTAISIIKVIGRTSELIPSLMQ